jgi:hypothetical protein
MYRKGKKYLADWRDYNGTRKRKAFPTAKTATRFETRMRNEAHEKKARASAALQTSAKLGPRRTKPTGPATQ